MGHRYLSERCMPKQTGESLPPPINPAIMSSSPPNGVQAVLDWIGNDARFIPAAEIDRQLHSENPMLQDDESVGMAFKSGRDTLVFTNRRVLSIDVQGFTGKKVEWTSIPYTSLRGFSVESAGTFDWDAEVKLFCKTYWLHGCPSSVFQQDLRKGTCDIIAVQNYLAACIF